MTVIKIKKWKKICDPKTGKMILTPPSILSNDWWNNLQIDLSDSFRKFSILNWKGKILLWRHRVWIREEQKKYKEDIFRRRAEAFHRNDPDFKTPRFKELSRLAEAWKELLGKDYKPNPERYETRESINRAFDGVIKKHNKH